MDPLNVLAKFEVRSFTHFWNNKLAVEVLGGVANPQSWGEKAVGGLDGTVRKNVGEFL